MRENARVIVEGMDGSGKSTLVESLLTLPGLPRFEKVRNTKGSRPDLGEWWIKELLTEHQGVPLHDRFFYPELVYGPVLRGFLGVEPGTIEYVRRYLRTFCFVIYCRPPDARISMALHQDREQWPGVREKRDELIQAYDNIMEVEAEHYGSRFFRYDYTKIQADVGLLEALEDYLD